MNTIENKQSIFPSVKDGDTFKIGDMEFIKFPSVGGKTPVVLKDIAFRSRFGKDNDFRSSEILKRLEAEVLPKIIAAVGEENVCTFKTDLTTWDGLKTYGEMESRISLPTMDFYRANVKIFDQHKADCWWWLATADSAKPHYDPTWVLCVSPSGGINNDNYNNDNGVRPFWWKARQSRHQPKSMRHIKRTHNLSARINKKRTVLYDRLRESDRF